MEVLVRLLRKYERTTVIVVSLVLTGSLMVTAYGLGELAKNYVWRLGMYLIFAAVFVFILTFREELLKNEK